MSRSIHETRRSWALLRRFDFAKPEDKVSVVDRAMRRLWKKRWIKNAVRQERGLILPPIDPVPVHLVPVRIEDTHPLIHYGASAADVQDVLQAMPSSITEGIREIRLRFGKASLDEDPDGTGEEERDPYFGRVSTELFPGLYESPILGTYGVTGLIAIYGFVWDRSLNSRLPSFIPRFFFRLRCLSVLAHEVAHHHDRVHRIARGRWLSHRRKSYEHYAEKMEWDWTHDYVFPYLERRYGEEWRQVQAWILHHGGMEPTLEHLGGDPRCTSRNGPNRPFPKTSEAILNLMENVVKGKSLVETRLSYAEKMRAAGIFSP